MIISLIMAVLLGLFIGVLSGLLGIGGGTVMVPTFRLVFGMSALASTATSLFTIIPTSISGLITHVRNKTCVPKIGIVMGLGGACTSPVGVWLSSFSPDWMVMVAAAIVIGYSAFTMLRKAVKTPSGKRAARSDAPQPDSGSGPTPAEAPVNFTNKQVAVGFAIGLIAGVVSGYVGVGGGFIMVPMMLSMLKLPMKKASGTSLIGIMFIAIPGAITQGVLGNIDYLVGVVTAIGAIPGAFIGARLVSRVPERTLRFLFAAFLGVGALLLVVNETPLLA